MSKFQLDKEKIEYINVFFTTFLVVATIVASIMMFTWFKIPSYLKHPKVYKTIEELDYYLLDFLIEKNQYLLLKFPKNYGYNIRLGTLYSAKKDYDNAEKQFLIAVNKSPYTAFNARYQLATLYIKLNRLEEAQELMDSVTDRADKKLIKRKGEIYYQIGNRLYEQNMFMIAATKYEKAIFYFKRCNKKKLHYAQIALSNAYEKIGDLYVERESLEDAIDYLKKADKLDERAIIDYKLALLYIESEPLTAAKYLDYVLKEDPELLDYYMYYDLLMKISESAGELGDTATKDLYEMKAKKFRDFAQNSLIYPNDLLIDILDVNCDVLPETKSLQVNLKFLLRNNSPFNINNLTVELRFLENKELIHKYEKTLFAFENIFPMGKQTDITLITTEIPAKILNPREDNITMQIYFYKNKKHKNLVKEVSIIKPYELKKYSKNRFSI